MTNLTQQTLREDELRTRALQQAAHDCRGEKPAAHVVERAEVYLAFLRPEVDGKDV